MRQRQKRNASEVNGSERERWPMALCGATGGGVTGGGATGGGATGGGARDRRWSDRRRRDRRRRLVISTGSYEYRQHHHVHCGGRDTCFCPTHTYTRQRKLQLLKGPNRTCKITWTHTKTENRNQNIHLCNLIIWRTIFELSFHSQSFWSQCCYCRAGWDGPYHSRSVISTRNVKSLLFFQV